MSRKDEFLSKLKVGSKFVINTRSKVIKGWIVALNENVVKVEEDDGQIATVEIDSIVKYYKISNQYEEFRTGFSEFRKLSSRIRIPEEQFQNVIKAEIDNYKEEAFAYEQRSSSSLYIL